MKSSVNDADLITPARGVKIWELGATSKINGAVAQIDGRYPKNGFVQNQKSDEVAYVLEGSGQLLLADDKAIDFAKGDQLTIPAGEGFAWEGDFTIYMACSPAFDPIQHVSC